MIDGGSSMVAEGERDARGARWCDDVFGCGEKPHLSLPCSSCTTLEEGKCWRKIGEFWAQSGRITGAKAEWDFGSILKG